ncbi:hypothetical protein HN51_018954 [Arachis hypogaea]
MVMMMRSSTASFTEQMYLCVAISAVAILYVSLIALESQWTNHGGAWLYQDNYNFPLQTTVLTTVET